MKSQAPLVTVCCVTYNHKNFVAQAINSFLMQKTSFDFEILIADDCSTDGALEVIKKFTDNFPERVRLLPSDKNCGIHNNLMNSLHQCKGKYIALCEGDDYWIDPLKLQKQIDFLEANPDYVMCCHYTKVINENDQTLYVHPKPVALEHTYADLLSGKQDETKTATVVYRNLPGIHQIFQKSWFLKCYAGDKLFKIFATSFTGGKIYVLPEVMSCYRNHSGGIWSMIDAKIRMKHMISDFNIIIKSFTYPSGVKNKLLLLYIKRYLLFELKAKQFSKALNTVKYLLQH
ncbi:MAG: glycosyltransferase [Mucilaginibacter sp.]|jgi:glycosyltransferase involved in cell wall biosynthesis|uniref:glycosyltransferase family 2 protein n=1 Tax=Mucilaginibacter sp. TaxID=1882438 RepID=UPI003569C42A